MSYFISFFEDLSREYSSIDDFSRGMVIISHKIKQLALNLHRNYEIFELFSKYAEITRKCLDDSEYQDEYIKELATAF